MAKHVPASSGKILFVVAVVLVISALVFYYEYLPLSTAISHAICPYGHVCSIRSNACAQPGVVYNCPSIPANTTGNYTVAVNLQEELNNSANQGFTLNQTVFYSNSSAYCIRELITQCDNNEPSQFICINSAYSGPVGQQYKKAHAIAVACPMFYISGTVYCGIQGNYCVVMHSA